MRFAWLHHRAAKLTASILGTILLALVGWYDWQHYDWLAISGLAAGVILLALPTIVAEIAQIKHENEFVLSTLSELTYQLLEIHEEELFDDAEAQNLSQPDYTSRDLRVTLLRVNEKSNPPRLEQVVRYSRSSSSPSKSTMTIHQGVAGLCYRQRKPSVVIVTINPEEGEFVDQMVESMGFTRDEAKQLEPRGTYMCSTIVGPAGKIVAILSVDSKIPYAFEEEDADIAAGITPFFARFLLGAKKEEPNNAR